MSVEQRRTDFLVGLLLVLAFAVLVVGLIFTKGWNRGRFDVYATTTSAEDLNVDTRVFLQGFEVGRVAAVAPVVERDSVSLRFVARLRLLTEYPGGGPVKLPRGTVAEIRPSGALVGGVVIALVLPGRWAGVVEPGDTLPSIRRLTQLEAIAQAADSLRDEITLLLTDTRDLVGRVGRTVDLAHEQVALTGPGLRGTLDEVRATLAQLRPALARADSVLATTHGRLGPLQDSILVTLGDARRLVLGLDSLTRTARGMADENREEIRHTIRTMLTVGLRLDHFLEQVSRRPLRMITGVRPLPPDTTPEASP